MARKNLYMRIATVPGLKPGLKADIAAALKPPGNIKKPETLAAWTRDELPALAEAAFRASALDGGVGHLAMIAWAVDHGDADSMGMLSHAGDHHHRQVGSERQQLHRALADMTHSLGGEAFPIVVGHGVDWMLRFIEQRAVILGVRLPAWWPHDKRPWGVDTFDTAVGWGGLKGHIAFDRLCELLSVDLPPGIPAEEIYGVYMRGEVRGLFDALPRDVDRLREAATRLRLPFGEVA